MKSIIDRLNKIYSNSNSEHNIYTPLDLCNKMLNSINDLSGDILVISNLEFLIQLKNKITLDKVYYATDCELKKRVAMNLGININNILNLQYNKEVIIATDMKFDIVVQNPPYNPNALWKKFVEKGIDMLKDDGKMVAIHPDSWRISSIHNKLFNHLKEHISNLHICKFENFLNINISTDWYLYNKQKNNNLILVSYCDSDYEELKTENLNRILPFSQKSIPYSILKKITTNKHNGIILLGTTGYHPLYKKHDPINGKYKQCGTEGRGTNWTENDFSLTTEKSQHQYYNKVVMSYTRKPRAKYFDKNDAVGVVRANYWLTNNKSLPLLLNSKIIWKLGIELCPNEEKRKTPSVLNFPIWFLESINFEKLTAKTEDELYKHYNLTKKEIDWLNGIFYINENY